VAVVTLSKSSPRKFTGMPIEEKNEAVCGMARTKSTRQQTMIASATISAIMAVCRRDSGQRKRMRLYLELTRRMAHNATVLVQYADAENNSCDPRRVGLASTLQQKAIEVRIYSLLTRIKLRLWLLLRSELLTSKPVLAHLRTAGDIDGLQTYNALKIAAAAAFVELPPDELESLTRSL